MKLFIVSFERVQTGKTRIFKGHKKVFFLKGKTVKDWACDRMNRR